MAEEDDISGRLLEAEANLRRLVQAYNDLAAKFNAHTHSGVTTGSGSTGANNQAVASADLNEMFASSTLL